METVPVAVVGATGYSGEELIRLLSAHPAADLCCVTSRAAAGTRLGDHFRRFAGTRFGGLAFSESDPARVVASGARFAFLALPHGLAHEFAAPLVAAGVRTIDLSADFRLRDPAIYRLAYGGEHPAPALLADAVYGMPELYRNRIRGARLVASPGCYPTSVILPAVPLLRAGLIDPDGIAVSSASGVSGAGRKADLDYAFCESNESLRPYGVPRHRHIPEIEQELSAAAGRPLAISFVPHLAPMNRGIATTLFARPSESAARMPESDLDRAIAGAFEDAYGGEPFVRLLSAPALPDTKAVTGTNFIDIAWRLDPRAGRVLLFSAEDNLVKGAGGQAIQSLNVMCGFAETLGFS